jgi:spermidine synthase
MINFAVCIFLSAFLLFQIQPIISKTLLPWFGGTQAVWSSAMLFFEIALTGGYAYSNWLVNRKKTRKQTIIHLILMGISVCLVIYLWIIWPSPITPAESWKPANITTPFLHVFFLLTISVGLPFFVLSTNSPLMQVWFSRKYPANSPYWLYALSNIGSLLGLILYPILIEPMLTIQWQGWIWTGGYLVFVLIAAYNAIKSVQIVPATTTVESLPIPIDTEKPKKRIQTLWIVLSATASLMVLAVTNQITQEVAVIPFLWVLPLAVYLLSFVFAFSGKRWYRRRIFTLLFLVGTCATVFISVFPSTNFIIQIIIYNFLLFIITMICHGELYALRPQAFFLTRFYLMVSIGGAIGGVIVNLIAPYIFRGYWEFKIGLAFVGIFLAILSLPRTQTRSAFIYRILVGVMTIAVTASVIQLVFFSTSKDLFSQRNFYGVVRVLQREDKNNQHKTNNLIHGSTFHGFQYLDPDLRDIPTSYYSRNSGVGLAILNNPHYGSGMRVAVLGLGVGTLAAYGQPGDYYRFYEINPVIVDLANGQGGYFSFIKDSQATIDIVIGDARISLEKELNAGVESDFDILVLDTFSSDSIPVHLVTRQAFEIYLKNLAPDGLIAAHISNNQLDLRPIFWQLAQFYKLDIALVSSLPEKADPGAYQSEWVLLSRNSELLEAPALAGKIDRMVGYHTNIRLWTDDYSNLFQILR